MRILLILCISLLLSCCSEEVHYNDAVFFFSSEGLTKSELMLVLDNYADSEGFKKLSEGGEGMLADTKDNFMLAHYINDNGHQFAFNNVLNRDCFTVAIFDKNHNKLHAEEIAASLRLLLEQKYKDTFVEHDNQHCRIAH